MAIKVLLISGVVVFAYLAFVSRQRQGGQALRRLAIVLFGVAAMLAVLFPALVSWVANRVGVVRGTDLVLYGLVIAFLFSLVGFAARFNDQEDRIVELARQVALGEASRVYAADLVDDLGSDLGGDVGDQHAPGPAVRPVEPPPAAPGR
jgi:hypothetical protein